MNKKLQALIFDCDGVLVDTERDGHRVAFNQAFAKKGLNIEWDMHLFGDIEKDYCERVTNIRPKEYHE
ncbi:MAG: hypothetical protein HQ580_00500 [Planctomycetes bacterium]|nr:hypothetical protein [Planctomycetota bacterium]